MLHDPNMEAPSETPAYLAETKQPLLRALTISVAALAVLFIAARMLVRQRLGTGIALDDWLIVASLACFLVLAGMNMMMIQHGIGLHVEVINPDQLTVALQGLYASELAYVLSISLTKFSLLKMYTRILPVATMHNAAYILGALVLAWTISIFGITVFQCTPVNKSWLPNLEGHCIDNTAGFFANAVPNITTDVAILALPIYQVRRLRVKLRQRLSVMAVFLLGSFVIFTSIYRFICLLSFDGDDFTWSCATPSTWTVVEAFAALLSASLPTFAPVLRLLKHKLGLASRSRSGRTIPSDVGGHSGPIGLVTIGGTDRRRGTAMWSQGGGNVVGLNGERDMVGAGTFERLDDELEGAKCGSVGEGRMNMSKGGLSEVSLSVQDEDDEPLRKG